jgi:diguanylate cyclase (GGDEF)-like protein
MKRTGWRIFAVAWLLALAAGLAVAAAPRPAPARAPAGAPPMATPSFELAVMETPIGTPLADILSGRAQPGFTPLLTPGLKFDTQPDRALWLRIRTTLPPGPSENWRLDLVRVPLDHVRLRLPPDGTVVAQQSFYDAPAGREPWSSNFALALPPGLAGDVELYLEMEGNVSGGLHVRLLSAADSKAGAAAARSYFRFVYGLLLLVAVLAVARRFEDERSGTSAVAAAAFCALLACLGLNGHLYSLPEIARLSYIGATAPMALVLLAGGPLLLAVRNYAGLEKSAPGMVPWIRGLAWLLVAAAAACLLLLPDTEARRMQAVAISTFAVAVGISVVMLLMDSRGTRWAPLVGLSTMVGLAVIRVLADRQVLPATLFNLYGWQIMLAVTMLLLVALPWLRARLVRWQVRRRSTPVEATTEEKIATARERLMTTLQSGLKNAADGDMKWIAFRRLLDGLKPVLPQTSAAVVAMHFHGEDLLQVEPKDAEGRYRELLAQRATLLKNISRLRAPQQIAIDFDGPDGPLDQVQLAIIPLPVPKPGWGALLVERMKDVTYSENELALCAEFAAVAIVAGDEAAAAVSAQRSAETDPITGTLRHQPLRLELQQRMEAARLKQRPLSLLTLLPDQAAMLREAGGEVGVAAGQRVIGELLREELEYGDVVGRDPGDGFLIVAEGKRLIEARDYAERLRVAISRMVVDPKVAPTGLTLSVGVAQAGPQEREPTALLQRSDKAVQIASRNGGNQIFS